MALLGKVAASGATSDMAVTLDYDAAAASGYRMRVAIIAGLFFIFGFVTWLNGTLIPFLQLACQLETWQALLVTFAFYIAYFVLALPSARILDRAGFKNGMAIGLAVMAVGCLVFVPAARARSFELFLLGLFVQGMGLALLQTAVNPYVSIIGPIESAAQRISIMGLANKTAGIVSPLILGSIVLKGASEIEANVRAIDLRGSADPSYQMLSETKLRLLDELATRIVPPYVGMTLVLCILALLIRRSPLPDLDAAQVRGQTAPDSSDVRAPDSVWRYPHLLFGALAIFFYVGAEVMAADAIALYGRKLGFSLDETRFYPALALGGMLVGYVLSIVLIPRFVSQQLYLRVSAVAGLVLTAATLVFDGRAAVACIALLGVANAVMWPAIFPLAIRGLGRLTQTGSALLIMGIGGGAVVPQVYGLLEEPLGYRAAFLTAVLPCYAFILFFAVRGYRAGGVAEPGS